MIDNDNIKILSLVLLDNNILPIRRSTKIRYTFNKYRVLAHHIALSTIDQNEIRELLSYNKTSYSPKAPI